MNLQINSNDARISYKSLVLCLFIYYNSIAYFLVSFLISIINSIAQFSIRLVRDHWSLSLTSACRGFLRNIISRVCQFFFIIIVSISVFSSDEFSKNIDFSKD